MKFRLLLLLSVFALPVFAPAAAATVDDIARYLAGLPVKGALEPLTKEPAWGVHADQINRAWVRKESAQLVPIRAWMKTHASGFAQSRSPLYYMFSGPDILYADTFSPNASTYILCGIEPVGQVPDFTRLTPEERAYNLAALRHAMSTILNFHYFIRKDMKVDFERGPASGTLPFLYVFLARLGHTVTDTSFVTKPAPGVKVTFTGPGGTQTLYYFKTDLSNGGGSAAFLRWCAAQGPGQSLLKAASFLMHGDEFSNVRTFLLKNSTMLLQDDSGIPLRSFTPDWTVQCFGHYVPHGDEFQKYNQPALDTLYNQSKNADLGFAFGYHWQKARGMLMLGTRK